MYQLAKIFLLKTKIANWRRVERPFPGQSEQKQNMGIVGFLNWPTVLNWRVSSDYTILLISFYILSSICNSKRLTFRHIAAFNPYNPKDDFCEISQGIRFF